MAEVPNAINRAEDPGPDEAPLSALELAERIRRTLEEQIASKTRAVDRAMAGGALNAAARADGEREGLRWALFVLAQIHGV